MKTKILALFLAVCSLLSLTACSVQVNTSSSTPAPTQEVLEEKPAVAEKTADVSNPMNTMPDYKSLASAQPTIKINDAPEGSTDVKYAWINNIPAIDQIDFTNDGHTYCYRAAACPKGSTTVDLSGVNDSLPSVTTVDVSSENQAGGSYVLRYDPDTGKGVANWASKMAESQYSLYCEDGCKGTKVEDMPFYKVMEKLFIYKQDAKTVSGTVVSATNNTLAMNLTDGSSAVLNCEHIKTITVKANDKVDVLYLGDIKGDADVVQITKTGTDTPADGKTFSGTIFRYIDNNIYVMTADSNIFAFVITPSTVVSGAATKLAENQEVIVTYTGDLENFPTATAVNVTKVGAAPKPTVVPTASPVYVDRYVEGVVTSVCGIWITVNGKTFEVNGANCYISGTPEVGGYANINYRDYGGGYEYVYAAYFAKNPMPAPTKKTYTTAGNIDAVNGPYVTVAGQTFTIATSNVEGSPEVGGYARIDYIDYGHGYTEVTYAKFTPKAQNPYPYDVRFASGIASNYTGNSVQVNGLGYLINGGTTINGVFIEGCKADVTYNAWKDGTAEATYIRFYDPPMPLGPGTENPNPPEPAPVIVGPGGENPNPDPIGQGDVLDGSWVDEEGFIHDENGVITGRAN